MSAMMGNGSRRMSHGNQIVGDGGQLMLGAYLWAVMVLTPCWLSSRPAR